ncbi:hypothetical protein LZ32DRAFT_693852 [Colletotrichum eremochloae]|nr:hypothetical protein LZ32DRAFT_693852 [Colletotrichum eremochloae]
MRSATPPPPRLVLRSAASNDAGALYGILSTPENHLFGVVPPGLPPEVMRARIGRWGPETASGKRALLVVAVRDTGELVGYGGFSCFETAQGGGRFRSRAPLGWAASRSSSL